MIKASRVVGAALAAFLGVSACSESPSEKAAGGADAPAGPVTLPPATNEEPGFLTAFADVDEIIGDVPHTVKLDVDVIDGTGRPPFTFKWDFGDATGFSTEKSPEHVYEIPGSFRASVIVTGSDGEIDQDYVDITVNQPFEYAVTPEQLKEALPVEDLVKDEPEKAPAKKPANPASAPPAPAAAE